MSLGKALHPTCVGENVPVLTVSVSTKCKCKSYPPGKHYLSREAMGGSRLTTGVILHFNYMLGLLQLQSLYSSKRDLKKGLAVDTEFKEWG